MRISGIRQHYLAGAKLDAEKGPERTALFTETPAAGARGKKQTLIFLQLRSRWLLRTALRFGSGDSNCIKIKKLRPRIGDYREHLYGFKPAEMVLGEVVL